MLPNLNCLKKIVNTSFPLFLKYSDYNRNPFLIVIFVFIISALTTLARAEISFTETTQEAGLTYTGPTWGAQWTDYNGDGWPDIWVTNHESKEPSLYLNMWDGTFEQISDSIWDLTPWPHHDTHGAGWADFDNDGDQDVLVNDGGDYVSSQFYVNDNGILYERAEEYGVSFPRNRGRGTLWLDFDNDGLLDAYMNGFASGAEGCARLFKQNEETGFFENVNSVVGISDQGALFSILSDLTGDGVLDLISYDGGWFPTSVYSMTTIPFTVYPRWQLFPTDTGLIADAAFADFNGDLLPDLYLARSGDEEEAEQVTSTKLAANIVGKTCGCEKGITFKSDGNVTILFSIPIESAGHPFFIGSSGLSPEAFPSYISPDDPRIWGFSPRIPLYLELDPNDPRVSGIPPHEPGVDVGVYIGFDADLSEWQIVSSQSLVESFWCKFIVESDSTITELTPLNLNMFPAAIDSLYIHNGVKLEQWSSEENGINKHLPGRSVVAGDFDNDMDLDIYVVNSSRVMNTPNIFFENDGTGHFTEVPGAGGAEGTLLGAGDSVVSADYNRDGFLDLFVTNGMYPSPFDHLGPIQLFKNNGNSNHWIEIDLVGTTSNRDGIGARVLVTAGGKTQLREQGGGIHKFSQNHTRIHFGLGQNSTIQSLEVQWPSGTVQVIENLEADKIIQVIESSGDPQPPLAVNDSARTDMDTAMTVEVLVNDYDPNYDTLTITAVQSPTDQGGIATINDNGSPDYPGDDFIDYSPPGGFSGTDTFTYTIDDGNGFTDTATVIVTVKAASNTCYPYGEPNYDPVTEDGIFLWKEGNVWHLRAAAGSSALQRKYTGSIVSDMEFSSVTPVSLEASDILNTSNSQMITFEMAMSQPYFDGLDFEFPAGATVYFDVQSNSGNAIDLVFIGGDRCPVDQLSYQLPSDSNTSPVAIFTADPSLGDAPLEVTFNASMSYDPDPNGSIVSYEWDYGDGTGSGLTTTHTYNAPGIYTVILTVTDNAWSTTTTNQTVTIVGTSTTCNPYGVPNYDPATEDGIFLWKEGNVWHLRATAGLSGSQRYTGSIISDMGFINVTPVNFEASDILDASNSQMITFEMTISQPWFDGLDFEFPAGATVYFGVQSNSGNAADLVFIGGNRCPVAQLPYQLFLDSNTAPVAIFTADPTLGDAPLEVTFNASMSYDPDADGSIVSYEWDYGDGTGSGAATSHTYNAPGIYDVSLTVTDDYGFTDMTYQTITVGTSSTCNPYEIPNYDPASEDGIFLWKEGTIWHLRAIAGLSGSQRYTGSIVSEVEFSRVTPFSFESNDTLDTSNSQVITFEMTMSQPYFDGLDFEFPAGATVYFDVQANSGITADLVFIGGNQCPVNQLPYHLPLDSNTAPVAIFTADPILGNAPLEVTFNASMSYDPDADGSIVSYEWDYGDGTDSGAATSHTYNAPGIYDVSLTVTDDYGFTDMTYQTITVGTSSTCNPYGEPNYDPATEDGIFLWQEGNIWHLRAAAGLSEWKKYTGSIVSDMQFSSVSPFNFETNDILDTSNSQAITFEMTMSRPYFDGLDFEFPAGATVYFDIQANSGVAADLVFIGGNQCPVDQLPYQLSLDSNTAPAASFTADSTAGEAPLTVSFDASGSTDDDGTIESYEWDYGDGTDSGVTASHTYNTAGSYTVTLTVTDDDDATNTANLTITVDAQNIAPIASFTADTTAGEAPLTVSFDASGSTDDDGTIESYEWDYGDGTDSGVTASHTYNTAGSYTVTLTVTDDDGATNTANQTITVDPQP
ncbi:PKD domain-containing protein [Desulfosediminicola flagellatus]|uniref:PKD domain-containing protein n=1 Tax=Desulfosediminicola flagellatus TaxID=2569541 RepID=UPI001593F75F|nr:PKD domain-containing protein [Desulfosediminicola flagellatus]